MPLVIINWLPKASRTAAVRREVAKAVIDALTKTQAGLNAGITADKVVVRFAEAQDGFPLPKGWTHENVEEK
ncbi:prasinophyte-specific protein-4 [Pavlovales sp. CCMP2436]|nr:prasinophyte-specific protein-4 [Pavlovales sp. CCMP2436]